MTYGTWSDKTFRFCNRDYRYFQPDFLDYNDSERVVEVALGAEFLKLYDPATVLEVGPVLQQYVGGDHLALDKYEQAPRTVTCDVVDFKPDRLYRCILSLSTLEHVGFNEYGGIADEKPNPKKILKAIAHLKSMLAPGGVMCVTLPLGYNKPMDKLLASGELRFTEQRYLKRVSADNRWVEATWEDVKDCAYDSPWHAAQALVIGHEFGEARLPAEPRRSIQSITFELHDTGPWGDVTVAPMVGGRERAVVRIAEELVCLGYQVKIETPVKRPIMRHQVWYEERCQPSDAIVSVTDHAFLKRSPSPVKIAWVQTGLPDINNFANTIDYYVVNSNAKAQYLHAKNPATNPDRFQVIGNGVDLSDYSQPGTKIRNRLLWQSSPDRGLQHLLRWWPKLIQKFPALTLHITYKLDSLEDYRWQQSIQSEWLRTIQQGLDQPGVLYRGPLSRDEHLREQMAASLWVFPCEITVPGETFCISAMEMAAARCPMLLSDDLSLREIYAGSAHFLPLPVQDTQWIEAITLLLEDPVMAEKFVPKALGLARQYTWENLAKQWDALFQKTTHSIQATVALASEPAIR